MRRAWNLAPPVGPARAVRDAAAEPRDASPLSLVPSHHPLERKAQRNAGREVAPGADAPLSRAAVARVERTTRAHGTPLDPEDRAGFEARLSHSFGHVRVHCDADAARAAASLGARAYTVGHHIGFAPRAFAPRSEDGRHLLAHELTHVMQADAREVAPTRVMRQPASGAAAQTAGPTPPLARSFKQVWAEFEDDRAHQKNAEALALADEILAVMMGEDAIEHGGDLVLWLLDQGARDVALRALRVLDVAWSVRFFTINSPDIRRLPWGSKGPEDLVAKAESEAAAGRHEVARELFCVAMLVFQMQYAAATDERLKALASSVQRVGGAVVDFPLLRIMAYQAIGDLIGQMRRILAFYPGRERQAEAAGDKAGAAREADLGRQLRERILEHYTLSGTPGLTLEATQTTSKRMGTGYTLHGANQGEVDVFPLPGTPRPDELGSHPAYTAPMEDAVKTLSGQEDFLTELQRNPAVRAAFPKSGIDMTDLATRLKVWRIMYEGFQKAPAPGCPDALCSLLRLTERYLGSFTTHTEYNIPDFGTYYVTTEEKHGFPTDLLGRTMRDCGVYALTVSYELFRTARAASPRLNLDFRIYNTLEHAMLAIIDRDHGKHYVVNNDKIEGPKDGVEPVGTVALSYSNTMQRNLVATAAGATPLGDTGQGEAAFRKQSWQRYQVGATFALKPEPSTGPDDKRTEGERREATYTGYYKAQEQFDAAGVQLHADLDALLHDVGAAADPARSGLIAARLPALTANGATLTRNIQMTMDPTRYQAADPKATSPVGLFTTGRTDAAHPLVRLAKLLLFYQKLGGTLTPDQQAIVTFAGSAAQTPSGWHADIAAYIGAARPPAW